MNGTSRHPVFKNRQAAGRQLAGRLADFLKNEDPIILALPRGGVPVAAEIAKASGRPLDVLIVRKLGVPGHEELAMGAIAGGGVRVLSEELISQLRLSRARVEAVIARESGELARREICYRGGRDFPDVAGQVVIVVDDGIATGSTMSAAIGLLRHLQAKRIIIAIPVAPSDTIGRLLGEADDVVTLLEPGYFSSVGEWYQDFSQTSDEEVRELLAGSQLPTA
jgi:putative phosphoribosyl transferase